MRRRATVASSRPAPHKRSPRSRTGSSTEPRRQPVGRSTRPAAGCRERHVRQGKARDDDEAVATWAAIARRASGGLERGRKSIQEVREQDQHDEKAADDPLVQAQRRPMAKPEADEADGGERTKRDRGPADARIALRRTTARMHAKASRQKAPMLMLPRTSPACFTSHSNLGDRARAVLTWPLSVTRGRLVYGPKGPVRGRRIRPAAEMSGTRTSARQRRLPER